MGLLDRLRGERKDAAEVLAGTLAGDARTMRTTLSSLRIFVSRSWKSEVQAAPSRV